MDSERLGGVRVEALMVNQGRLTRRESEVAGLIAEGHADKAIARLLAMSIRTVQAHTMSTYEKLGLREESLSANMAALNLRVRAVAVMVARGMVQLSINSLFAFIVLSSAALDDQATRVRSGGRVSSVMRVRRCGDA